jgi:hypothetical protein
MNGKLICSLEGSDYFTPVSGTRISKMACGIGVWCTCRTKS